MFQASNGDIRSVVDCIIARSKKEADRPTVWRGKEELATYDLDPSD